MHGSRSAEWWMRHGQPHIMIARLNHDKVCYCFLLIYRLKAFFNEFPLFDSLTLVHDPTKHRFAKHVNILMPDNAFNIHITRMISPQIANILIGCECYVIIVINALCSSNNYWTLDIEWHYFDSGLMVSFLMQKKFATRHYFLFPFVWNSNLRLVLISTEMVTSNRITKGTVQKCMVVDL